MNVICLNGHILDLDQLVATELRPSSVLLTFKNNDTIELTWREPSEEAAIRRALNLPFAGNPSKNSTSAHTAPKA